MKTTYRDPRRSSMRRRLSPRAALLALVLLTVFGVVLAVRSPASEFLWKGITPLRSLGKVTAALSLPFEDTAALVAENAKLSAELFELRARLADRDALSAENIELKQMLGRGDAGGDPILAVVLARPPALPYDTLLLDVGRSRGVAEGDLVSAGEGAFIGTITEAGSSFSRVTLFSSASVQMEGMLEGSVAIAVEGEGNGALSAEVPATLPARVGDTVLFPSIHTGVAAVVSAIDAPEGSSFKRLHLHLPVPLSSLRTVEILRGQGSISL